MTSSAARDNCRARGCIERECRACYDSTNGCRQHKFLEKDRTRPGPTTSTCTLGIMSTRYHRRAHFECLPTSSAGTPGFSCLLHVLASFVARPPASRPRAPPRVCAPHASASQLRFQVPSAPCCPWCCEGITGVRVSSCMNVRRFSLACTLEEINLQHKVQPAQACWVHSCPRARALASYFTFLRKCGEINCGNRAAPAVRLRTAS